MGSPVFDRQVFVKKQAQKPPSKSPLPGAFVLLLVAGLSAFATYRYVNAGGKSPSDSADKAQIAELQGKLKAMQARVNELEKRRHTTTASHVPDKKADLNAAKPAASENTLFAEPAPHLGSYATSESNRPSKAVAGNTDHPASAKAISESPIKTSSSAVKSATPVPKTPTKSGQTVSNKELTALQGNIAASHDEWQATTDRLGNVVGELDSQRSALQKTQTGISYLLERVQSSDVSFTLTRGSGLQRVGPISMELESTSVKGQHYNIRMMVDDKSIELKDRALNEIVQFYTSRSKYPLRLIVSQIGRGEVSGTLAVPTGLSKEMSNTHLQER
jgi:hypothetical protein